MIQSLRTGNKFKEQSIEHGVRVKKRLMIQCIAKHKEEFSKLRS